MRGFEYKKSLNIPRGKSESVIQRTDNTMAKIKRPNTDLQNTTQKTKDRATQTPLKTNNDLQNITQKTEDRATQTPLKTNNDLQNITQKTEDRATQTPLKTNNDLQNTTQKTKDRATQTSLKKQGELMCSRRVSSSFSTSVICCVTLVTHLVIRHG
jgi:lipopolysaccharide export LptBFGC system permease protein LptF